MSIAAFYLKQQRDGRAVLPKRYWAGTGHRAVWIARVDGEYTLCADPDLRRGLHVMASTTAMQIVRGAVLRFANDSIPRRGRPPQKCFRIAS